MELASYGPWTAALVVLVVAGLTSYGLVWLLKKAIRGYLNWTTADDKEPKWWNTALRISAVVCGLAVGGALSLAGAPLWMGLPVGAAGGAMNTLIYMKLKAYIKSLQPPSV